MREIEFRAKNLNDQWRYGYLERQDLLYDENYDCSSSIQIETLGQFTGRTDKNGTKIFEGDIVKILYTDWASKSENDTRTLEEYLDSLTKVGVVVWDNLYLCYVLKFKNGSFGSIHCGKYGYIEVIGNIFDNGDLTIEN